MFLALTMLKREIVDDIRPCSNLRDCRLSFEEHCTFVDSRMVSYPSNRENDHHRNSKAGEPARTVRGRRSSGMLRSADHMEICGWDEVELRVREGPAYAVAVQPERNML